MTIITPNSISGINSITAQSNSLNFYTTAGSTLSIGASVSGNITGNVTGNLTGNVTGNINSSGVSTITTLQTGAIQTTSNKTILASTGSILKVSSNKISSNLTTTSTSFVASGLITTMTPINSNSNFYVTLLGGRHGQDTSLIGCSIRIYVSVNGGAYSQAVSGNGGETLLYSNSGSVQAPISHSLLYVPGVSVSTISFQPYFRVAVNPGTVYFNYYDSNSYGEPTLTIFEISA